MTYPGAVKFTSQLIDGNSSAAATSQPRRNRVHAGWSAISRSSSTRPMNASGHQPHGGSDAANRIPASAARPTMRIIGLRRSEDGAHRVAALVDARGDAEPSERGAGQRDARERLLQPRLQVRDAFEMAR